MCDRRSRVTGSMVWYSSSTPMVKVGFFISFLDFARSALRRFGFGGRDSLACCARLLFWTFQEFTPAIVPRCSAAVLSILHRKLGHGVNNPGKIRRGYRVVIGVGGGI